MTGCLAQLSQRGEQNRFLDIKPQIYLFKTKYKRHSGFAFQTQELHFNTATFGETSTCFLLKDPDLITHITLRIQLPTLNIKQTIKTDKCTKQLDLTCFCNKCCKHSSETIFGYANSIGHLIVNEYSFNVGSKTLDKRTGEWLEWWSEFTQTTEKKAGYWEMIGKREPASFKPSTLSGAQELLVPLDFYFAGKTGHAFPLCAICEKTVSVTVKWNDFINCWITNTPGAKPALLPQIKASLLVESVYIDNGERNSFIKNNHLYLIEQIQKNGPSFHSANTHMPSIDLCFTQPIKSIYWAIRRSDSNHVSLDKDDPSFGNDWYNYSCFKSRSKNVILDPVDSCQLFLNGEARESVLPAKFYRLLQPYYRHTKTPSNYIYNYSFSFYPEDNQPSGTCNMSMYNSIKLKLQMNPAYNHTYEVTAYAISYNFVIIKNGKVSLAFII